MNHDHETNYSEHQKVSMLLPWYVNKTLLSDENIQVKTHLKSCLICRIELTNLQKLSASIRQEDSFAPVAHASFLQLKNRIHKTEAQTREKNGMLDGLLACRQWFANLNPRSLAVFSPSFALASILVLTYSLISPAFFAEKNISATSEFRTLSNTKRITVNENEIRLVFSSEITQKQIMQILASVQGEIVAGPNSQGVFRVRVGTSKDVIKTLSLLRNNTHVVFAEPTFAFITPNNQSPG